MRGVKVFAGAAASALLLACMGPLPALADTIDAALVRAYQNNPQLNAQRAQVRFTDENVPQALSGYRPPPALTAPAARHYLATHATAAAPPTTIHRTRSHRTTAPRIPAVTGSQTRVTDEK